MNLPELLKIAEEANSPFHNHNYIGFTLEFERKFNPSVAIELIKRLQEAEKNEERYRHLMMCNTAEILNLQIQAEETGKSVESLIDKKIAAMKGASNDQTS